MIYENARQLAYAVLFQAVRDYVSGKYNRKKILHELRCMGELGKITADKLEFHLDEVMENIGKEHLLEEVI